MNAATRLMSVGTRSQTAKVRNGDAMPEFTATSRFWGFPIGLITLPVVMATASDRSRSFGEIFHFVASASTSGVPMMAIVSFIRTAERMPMPKRMMSTTWSGFFAREKRRFAVQERYPLSTMASPTTNMPNRKTITSTFMARNASGSAIWPVSSTARAPASMTCQIRMVNLPTCRTAISRKTAARTMTAMYVDQAWKCRVIGVGISDWSVRTWRRRMPQVIRLAAGEGQSPSPELFRVLRLPAGNQITTSNLKYSRAEPASWICGS